MNVEASPRVWPIIQEGRTVAPPGYVLKSDGLCDPIDPSQPMPKNQNLRPAFEVKRNAEPRPRVVDGKLVPPQGYKLLDTGVCELLPGYVLNEKGEAVRAPMTHGDGDNGQTRE